MVTGSTSRGWVSERGASSMLAAAGLTRRHARRVLAAGLAGEPIRTTAATLYEAERVRSLLSWPTVTLGAAGAACPDGLLVLRREVPLTAPRPEQLSAVSGGWGLSWWTVFQLNIRRETHGPLPVVVTMGGFVVLGASAVRIRAEPLPAGPGARRHLYALDLEEPGDWYRRFAGHRLPGGPGRPWVLVWDGL